MPPCLHTPRPDRSCPPMTPPAPPQPPPDAQPKLPAARSFRRPFGRDAALSRGPGLHHRRAGVARQDAMAKVPVLIGASGFIAGEHFILGDPCDVVIGRSRSCEVSLQISQRYNAL